MITRFRVQNYKALRDVTLDLTPIHVLIGPNDSGKTSILEALAAFSRSADHPLQQAFMGSWKGRELIWQGNQTLAMTFEASVTHEGAELTYELSCQIPPTGERVTVLEENAVMDIPVDFLSRDHSNTRIYDVVQHGQGSTEANRRVLAITHKALAGVHVCRWIPAILKLPVALNSLRKFRMESTGFGLAQVLDDILGYDRNRFTEIEQSMNKCFPDLVSLKLMAEQGYAARVDDPRGIPILQEQEGKGIYFESSYGGPLIPARSASDGTIIILAYLAVLHLPKPPPLILIEEPENGIHPHNLERVIGILKQLVREHPSTQIVMTTHSPYTVDLFEPQEVTLCVKADDGSVKVRRLSDSEAVRKDRNIFTLGEIWTGQGDEALAK